MGDFIYLIAINLLVYEMTGSAAAVAGLWIIAPITAVLTNSWSGRMIDRNNKKSIMIWTDLARFFGVALIPFLGNIGVDLCRFIPDQCWEGFLYAGFHHLHNQTGSN